MYTPLLKSKQSDVVLQAPLKVISYYWTVLVCSVSVKFHPFLVWPTSDASTNSLSAASTSTFLSPTVFRKKFLARTTSTRVRFDGWHQIEAVFAQLSVNNMVSSSYLYLQNWLLSPSCYCIVRSQEAGLKLCITQHNSGCYLF